MDYGCSTSLPIDDERQELWRKQRGERGFDDTETWSLDFPIAHFLVPRLQAFKDLHFCHPCGMSMEDWDGIIQEMIDGFSEYVNCKDKDHFNLDYTKVDRAWKLLAEWYNDLWW